MHASTAGTHLAIAQTMPAWQARILLRHAPCQRAMLPEWQGVAGRLTGSKAGGRLAKSHVARVATRTRSFVRRAAQIPQHLGTQPTRAPSQRASTPSNPQL